MALRFLPIPAVAHRGPPRFTLADMAELAAVRVTPNVEGDFPELDDLAMMFSLPRLVMNRIIDALQGREPELAHESLVARGVVIP